MIYLIISILCSVAVSVLLKIARSKKIDIEQAVAETGQPLVTLRYLPMVGRKDAWTAWIDSTTAKPLGFLPLDSF